MVFAQSSPAEGNAAAKGASARGFAISPASVLACTRLSAGSAARIPWRTYIQRTASRRRMPYDVVCAGQETSGGAGKSGL